MRDAWLVDQSGPALTLAEAWYLATKGGDVLFRTVGNLERGYWFDAVAMDDDALCLQPENVHLRAPGVGDPSI